MMAIRTTFFIVLALTAATPWTSASAGDADKADQATPERMDAQRLSAELDALQAEVRSAIAELRSLKRARPADGHANRPVISDQARAQVMQRIDRLLGRQDGLDQRIGDLLDRQRRLEAEAAPQDDKPSPGREPRFDYRYEDEPASRWPSPAPVVDTQPRFHNPAAHKPDRTANRTPTLSPHHTLHDKTYQVRSVVPARPSVGPAIRVGASHHRGGYVFRHDTHTHQPAVSHRARVIRHGLIRHGPHHRFYRSARCRARWREPHHTASHLRIHAGGVYVIWR